MSIDFVLIDLSILYERVVNYIYNLIYYKKKKKNRRKINYFLLEIN